MLDREASEFRRVAEEVDVLRLNAPFSDDEIYEWFTAYYELILTDEPITVTSEYSGKLLYKTFDARTNEILGANVPPTFALIQRINLGLFSLMGKRTDRQLASHQRRAVGLDRRRTIDTDGRGRSAWVASGVVMRPRPTLALPRGQPKRASRPVRSGAGR